VTLSSPGLPEPTFTAPEVTGAGSAVLTFRLTVTDNGTPPQSVSDDVVITVTGNSTPPTANAGGNRDVDEGTLVTLDGSASVDTGGSITAHEWVQLSGETVKLSSNAGAVVTFEAPRVGLKAKSLRFKLTVRDNENAEHSAEVTINIRNTKNDPPTADAGRGGEPVTQGQEVTLSGIKSSDADGDDTILTYLWTQDPADVNQVALSSPNASSTTFTTPSIPDDAAFQLNFKLSVTDEEGAISLPASVVINVALGEGKLRPTADAGPDQAVGPGAVVQLDGSKSRDQDNGTITAYNWTSVNPEVVFSDPAVVNPVFTVPAGMTPGSQMEITLTVTDNEGFVGTDDVVISVGSNPPVVDAGEKQTVEEGTTVTLTGTSSDNGGVASRLWTQVEGPDVVLAEPSSEDGITTFVTPIVDGVPEILFRFEFQATDNENLASTDMVEILVTDNGITGINSDFLPVAGVPFSPGGGSDNTAPIGFKLPAKQGHIVLLEAQDPGAVKIKQGLPRRMPYGLFDLHIKTIEPGATVTVEIQLSSPAPLEPNGFAWFKYDEETGWGQYEHAQISSDRSFVTLTLTDGGAGDSDKVADGIIRDPSGLGEVSTAVLFSGSSGGGGTGIWALVGLGLFIRFRRVRLQ
jgi:hypothetical protein